MWNADLIKWQSDETYIRLWIFADHVMCENLQNSCMDNLRGVNIGGLTGHPKAYLLKHIVDQASLDSALYKYYVKQMAWDLRNDERRERIASEPEWKDLSSATLRDVVILAMTYHNTGKYKCENPAEKKGCAWHVHEETHVGDCTALLQS